MKARFSNPSGAIDLHIVSFSTDRSVQNLINRIRSTDSSDTTLGSLQTVQADTQSITIGSPSCIKRNGSNAPTCRHERWRRNRFRSTSNRNFEIIIELSANPSRGKFIRMNRIVDDGPFCGGGGSAKERGRGSHANGGTGTDGVGEELEFVFAGFAAGGTVSDVELFGGD